MIFSHNPILSTSKFNPSIQIILIVNHSYKIPDTFKIIGYSILWNKTTNPLRSFPNISKVKKKIKILL